LSEIRVTTISDTAGTGPVTLTKQQAAKAWFYWTTNTTTAIIGSFNFSSLTDSGTGDTTLNLTNNFNDANEMATVGMSNDYHTLSQTAPTVSSVRIATYGSSHTANDISRNFTVVHGDLA